MATPEYEWILCRSPNRFSPFAELEKLGILHSAKGRSFDLVRNRAGSARFDIRTNDDMAQKILEGVDFGDIRGTVKKCIRIRRNKKDLWSGPIWGISGDLDNGNITCNCVGWLEKAVHRILWNWDAHHNPQALDYSNNGLGTSSDRIAFGLIRTINNQDPDHPLDIRPGSVTGTMPIRNRFYPWGSTNLGAALQELSDIEAGFDYEVDPITREVNLYSWDSFRTVHDAHLGYNWGPKNLKNVTWQEAADKTCNFMGVQSQGSPVFVPDRESQDEYGLFEENNTLTAANQSILVPYAVAEMVIRGKPLLTFTLTPMPGSQTPALFDDYQIGEKIFFTARKDHIKINKQAIRVFGASINIDDNGNETVSQIMVAPTS